MAKKKTEEVEMTLDNIQFDGEAPPPRLGVPTADVIDPGPAPDEDGASEDLASSATSEDPDHHDADDEDASTVSGDPEQEDDE